MKTNVALINPLLLRLRQPFQTQLCYVLVLYSGAQGTAAAHNRMESVYMLCLFVLWRLFG